MIESDIRNYLASKLDVEVYTEIPPSPPKSFVRLEVVGGTYDDFIRSSSIAIQSYDETLFKASKLNEEVINEMIKIAEEVENVYSCTLESSYNFTDTTTKKYRYQAVFEVNYY